jgi:hypothetical protein
MNDPNHVMKQKVVVVNVLAADKTVIDLTADADKYSYELVAMVAATGASVNVQGFHDIAAAGDAAATDQQLTADGKYCFSIGKKTAGNTAEVYRYLKVFCPVATRVTVSRWFRG